MGTHLSLTAADGHQLDAYRADPDGTPRGGVVVVAEIFGVNSHIRSVADRFAALGYLAIAPAIFDRYEKGYESGYAPEDFQKAMGFLRNLKMDEWLLDIAAAREAIAGDVAKVAITGFCLGGSLAYLAAARLPGFAAASCYYGGIIAQFADEKPKIPTIAHFGLKDTHITAEHRETLRTKQPQVPIYLYPAGHAFNRDPDPSAFDAFSAQVAWGRTLELFAAAMK
ncbi:MAG: dienelactone hydrolase family protein [Ancalomicrobiaceae bacterium]|nr:dienelactone hydrolase family protein [Ancalomicrobiaceae bacterium]